MRLNEHTHPFGTVSYFIKSFFGGGREARWMLEYMNQLLVLLLLIILIDMWH